MILANSALTTVFAIAPKTFRVLQVLFVFFAISLIVFELQYPNQLSTHSQKLFFFASIVALNDIHPILTYLLLGFNSNFHFWIKEKYGGPKKFLGLLFGIVFFYFSVYLLRIYFMDKSAVIFAFLFGFVLLVQDQHNLFQTFGLSRLINQNIGAPESFTNLERRLYNWLFAINCLSVVIFSLRILEFEPSQNEKFHLFLTLLAFLSSAIVAQLFYVNFQLSKNQWREKRVFLLRLIFWPFVGLSIAARLALFIYHGLEYLFVYLKISRNSSAGIQTLILAIVALIGYGSCIIFSGLALGNFASLASQPIQMQLFAATLFAFNFAHRFLDRQMFRMRNPLTLRYIGKLLQ